MEQDKVNRVSDVGKNVWAEDGTGRRTMVQNKQASLGQRWDSARPTKTIFFWSILAVIVLTVIIGFVWGGWVTGVMAQNRALASAENAVVERLAPLCVAQFNQDPEKDQKLTELKETRTWERGDYIAKQGGATMPGEAKPDSKVATECARQLILASQ